MRFTKMHGLGNDYLYVEAAELPADAAELARRWSDRHIGVGADGIIWILPPVTAGAGTASGAPATTASDACMRIFNADGSEAKMCGNGIRCVGAYLWERRRVPKERTRLRVDTLSGVKTLDVDVDEAGHVRQVTVEMGQAKVSPAVMLGAALGAAGEVHAVPVDVGNPHAVVFCEDAKTAPVDTLGPVLEHDPLFPGGVNVEFVSVAGSQELRIRVWERGSGITMACGTGACASVAAAVARGLVASGEAVCVHLDGGDLHVSVDAGGGVLMRGPVAFVCDGETCD